MSAYDTSVQVVSVVAGIQGAIGWGPQVFRTLRRKSVRDISALFLFNALSSLGEYLYFGIGTHAVFFLVGVFMQFLLVLWMVFLWGRYRKNPEPQTEAG
jgi:uncharacterized protein with PQ loop repeat